MEESSRVVDGFVFPSYQEAKIALKEQKNIEIIRQRTPLTDGKEVYDLYQKLLEREMFKTMVGYSFLHELYYRLTDEFGYSVEELPKLELPKQMEYDVAGTNNRSKLEEQVQQLTVVKKRQGIVIAALSIMVIAMFVIAALNPNAQYVNSENKILNKYAAWQEELEQREQQVKEKEAQLNISSEE